MVLSLMMSAKLDILGSLRIKLFWNKVYDVIGLPHDSIKTLVTQWFLRKKLSEPQFHKDLTTKTYCFEGCSCFKFKNVELAVDMAFKFYLSVKKELKLDVRKFYGLILAFVEVTEVKKTRLLFANPSTPHLE